MLSNDLIGSLFNNTLYDLSITEIEPYTQKEWSRLCHLVHLNKSLNHFSLFLDPVLHTDNSDILQTRGERVSELLSALNAHPALTKFELSLGRIDDNILSAIVSLISSNKNICSISLPVNQLEKVHLDALFPAIQENKNINTINLSTNLLQYTAVKPLKEIMLNRKMYHFDVSCNNLSNAAIRLLFMPESYDFNESSVEFLNLRNNNINKFGMNKLYKRLKTVPTSSRVQLSTSRLFLSDNPISCMGGKSLARILKSGFVFDEIYVDNTGMVDRTVVHLCNIITKTRNNPKPVPVRVLSLESINILTDGAAAIAKLIRTTNSLEKISLSYNRINPANKLIISEALRYNHTLKQVHFYYDSRVLVQNSYVNTRGPRNQGEHMLDAVRENVTLEHFDFCGTWSGKDAKLYSEIVLQNLYDLIEELEILSKINADYRNRDTNQKRYLSGLNYCNTMINRIENYYQSDCKRGPEDAIDPAKQNIFTLQEKFECQKKIFRQLSMKISFYDNILQHKTTEMLHLFDPNINTIIHDLVGKNLQNIFLTNFILEKSKSTNRPILETQKVENEYAMLSVEHEEQKFLMRKPAWIR